MLIRKDAPKKEIRALKRGDFFIDGEIVTIHKTERIISIITSTDNLYNAHMKNGAYTIFRINKHKRKLKISRNEELRGKPLGMGPSLPVKIMSDEDYR